MNVWRKLKVFNIELERMLTPATRDGIIVISKADKVIMLCLAPLIISFFLYVRSSLLGLLGGGFVDKAVRICLEEMYLTFAGFALIAVLRCFFSFKWLEVLLAKTTGSLILVIEIIYATPFVLLVAAALFNLLHA